MEQALTAQGTCMHKIVYDRPFWDKEYSWAILGLTGVVLVLTLLLFMGKSLPWSLFWYVGPGVVIYCLGGLFLAEYFRVHYMRTFYHGYYLCSEIIKFTCLAPLFLFGAVVFTYFIPFITARPIIACLYAIACILAYPYQLYHFLKSQQYVKKWYSPTPVNGKIFINWNKIVNVEMKKYTGTWSLFYIVMIPHIIFLGAGGKIWQLDLAYIAFSTNLLFGGVYCHFRLNRALYVWFFIVRKVQKQTGCYVYSDVYNMLTYMPEVKEKLLASDAR